MNWLYYIAEANLYLGVFYLAYCIFLSKETHYQLNRGYLLASCAVAFTVPLVQLGFLKPVEYLVLDDSPIRVAAPAAFTWLHALLYLYIIGVVFFAARFVLKLYQLKKLISNNTVVPAQNYSLVSLQGADTAFSFFNYLFVGTKTDEAALITRHELVHIRQKHSVDIVFVELLQIISWFNPAVYLLQNSLKTVHEYVADEQTALSENDNIAYATYLLNNAYGISGPAMTHSFFNYNLLKKRIIMLHQKRSGNLARLKYLIAAPLCLGLLYQSTFGFDKTYALINIAPKAPVFVQGAAADTVPAKLRVNQNVNVEPLLKGRVKGLNIQNQKKSKSTGVTTFSDGVTQEQVFVQDKNGKLIDFYTEEGKKIHAENLAKEQVEKSKKSIKGDKTSDQNVPAANVEQLLDGKVRGYIIVKDREPFTDALNRNQNKVKGYNIQKGATTADATKIIQQLTTDKAATQGEIRIDEPQTELRMEGQQQPNDVVGERHSTVEGTVTKVSRIPAKNGRPAVTVTDVKLDKPKQQSPKKLPPPPPPMPPKVDRSKGKKSPPPPPVPPKPDVTKVKFPPPPPVPPKPDVTKVKFPPPPPVPPKPDVSKVKFPPPIVRPDKPAKTKKTVKFPPPVVKRDSK